jgi:tetratricopeptide (TPR) repeat protein
MLKMGEPGKAAMAFESAVASKPQDANLIYLLARSEYENGQYDRAFDLLRQFAIDNNDVTAWTLLAEYSLQLDDPDTASHAIQRAIELNSDSSAGPYLTAANLAERLGNDQEALRRLRQAYGCEPTNPEVDRRLREYGEIPGPSLTLGADE